MREAFLVDYYISLNADEYLHGKMLHVSLKKDKGGLVGITLNAGKLQIENCYIKFITNLAQ